MCGTCQHSHGTLLNYINSRCSICGAIAPNEGRYIRDEANDEGYFHVIDTCGGWLCFCGHRRTGLVKLKCADLNEQCEALKSENPLQVSL